MSNVKIFYDKIYRSEGFKAQRLYPNEELLRFLGVNFFSKTVKKDRKNIKVLEVGCGSCANLWMISKEGFDAYGIDISKEALNLGQQMLGNWQVKANLQIGDFLELPYENENFDIIIDVISMYCVNHQDSIKGISEVYRTLKKGGLFFAYEASKNSSVFKDYLPAKKIDEHTLDGVHRKTSPFYGNKHAFHFWDKEEFRSALINKGFSVEYLETTRKSYYQNTEQFEYLTVYARKI